jgi:hypothetical protein
MYSYFHPNKNIIEHPLNYYYQYFDLISLRGKIYDLIDDSLNYSEIFNPILLEKCNENLMEIYRKEFTSIVDIPIEKVNSKFESINNRKMEIYKFMDKYEKNSFQNLQEVPNNVHYEILLEYCNYKIKQIKDNIEKTNMTDPFKILQEKFKLQDKEMEILVILFFSNFVDACPLRGIIILKKMFGMQYDIFDSQSLLFSDSKLIKNNLIKLCDKDDNFLNSTYGIAERTNLFISGLVKDIN